MDYTNLKTTDFAVQVSACIRKSPLRVELSWLKAETISYFIYRRMTGATRWLRKPHASLNGKVLSWVDADVEEAKTYEYKIVRNGKGYKGFGYICVAVNAALVENRGKVILLVEHKLSLALKKEISQLIDDLTGDFWHVIKKTVGRNSTAKHVKSLIKKESKKDPIALKSVFILGHIPVPYSGSIFPDGHSEHRGAWPADVYYADMSGPWSDNKVKRKQANKRTTNLPGDGKFDQSRVIPGSPALQVGRVDLSQLPVFKESEIELYRRYLEKDHRYRHAKFERPKRAILFDGFGTFNGEAFAASGWRAFSTCVGKRATKEADIISTIQKETYLFAYGCGAGSYESCAGVGMTEYFSKIQSKAVFTMLFGSYFGDWDSQNSFLRAPLAAKGYSLTSVWAGRPHWFLHHMGIGETIGYSTMRSQYNDQKKDYEGSGYFTNQVHVALMGDPTLRLDMLKGPTKFRMDKQACLHWKASVEKALTGYYIYFRKTSRDEFVRLTERPVKTCTYQCEQSSGEWMLKAIKLQRGPSGNYYTSSQGIFLNVR
ncbi:MAG: hypothetical protein HRT89_18795 [Lentisphaeria bacterium]|nr:hypothetical protein [Lentisphaeria bacterium]NQZ70105.1 hypothetical protein [Lentisphaeria bacterium]